MEFDNWIKYYHRFYAKNIDGFTEEDSRSIHIEHDLKKLWKEGVYPKDAAFYNYMVRNEEDKKRIEEILNNTLTKE